MPQHETAKDIEAAAAIWAARLDAAPLSAEKQAELAGWMAGDPRRRGALLRAQALWLKADQLNALSTPVVTARARTSRNHVRWWSAAAASMLMAILFFAATRTPTAYATALGEVRLVPLSDGSSVTLNTDSRIEVIEHEGRPRVRLIKGEAFFQIASGGTQPFVIELGNARVETRGAGFLARRLAGHPAQVLAQAGELHLQRNGGAPALRLGANTALSLADTGAMTRHPASLSDKTLRRELAWREGKIEFEGESLAEAAAAFARYNRVQIVIADPVLASEPVSGLFATNDPMGFGRAAAKVFHARLSERDDRIVLSRAN